MTNARAGLLLAGAAAMVVLWTIVRKRPVRGLYLAIFGSAILLTPQLPLVRDKVAACEVIMAVTWLAALVHVTPSTPLLAPQRGAILRATLFLAAAGLSFWAGAVAENLDISRSGVELLNYVYGVMLFASVVYLVQSWDEWLWCFYAWALGTALVAAVAVVTLLGHGPAWAQDTFTGRVSSTLKFSNQLPGYCIPILALLVVIAALRGTRPALRWITVSLAAGIGLSVVGSGSRLGLVLLGLSIAAAFGLGVMESGNRALDRSFLIALEAAAAVAVVLFVLRVATTSNQAYALGKTPAYQRAVRMGAGWLHGAHALDDTRTRQLRLVSERLPQQLVLGVGPANFTLAFHTDEIHNTYAGVLAEEGLFGLAALAFWLLGVVHNGRLGLRWCPTDTHRLIVLAVFIGFGMLLIYGTAMFGLRQRPFWFLAGLLVALPRVMEGELAAGRSQQ